MVVMSISFFAIATGIIIGLLNYFYSRLSNFERDLPKRVSYYFGSPSRLSPAEIIAELKKRLALRLEEKERNKYNEWVNEYFSNIRDIFIVKILLVIDIVLIIAYALYCMLQSR